MWVFRALGRNGTLVPMMRVTTDLRETFPNVMVRLILDTTPQHWVVGEVDHAGTWHELACMSATALPWTPDERAAHDEVAAWVGDTMRLDDVELRVVYGDRGGPTWFVMARRRSA